MKTKAQKKKAEEKKEHIQFLMKLIGLFFLLISGVIYYFNSNNDTTTYERELSDNSFSIETVKKEYVEIDNTAAKVNTEALTGISGEKKNDVPADNLTENKNSENHEVIEEQKKDTVTDENVPEPGNDAEDNVKININTASYADLCKIKGIGPSKAEKIIAYRDKNGSFSCIEDIMKVPGIKNGIFDKIRDSICADPPKE